MTDLEDTDKFVLGQAREPHDPDDTAKLRFDLASRRSDFAGAGVHPYLQGIIRLYRARSVLLAAKEVTRDDAARAWKYIAPVGLRHLPHDMGSMHLELVYLVHTMSAEDPKTDQFVAKVLAMTQMIDDFVDQIFPFGVEGPSDPSDH